MKRGKPDAKRRAYDLYCNTDLTQKEVAVVVGVSTNHMNIWVQQGNWKLHRTAGRVTREKLVYGYYMQLAAINEVIESQGNVPTTGQSDIICKIVDAIDTLHKKYNLSVYHSVIREFIEYLMQIDMGMAKDFGTLMLEFLKDKANRIANDKAIGQ